METLAGIVLAGGMSRRMGEDKALIKVGGSPLITRAVDALLTGVERVIVVGPDSPSYHEALAGRNVRFVSDRIRGIGPLGGIHAGLTSLAENETGAIIVACDMPCVSPMALRFLGEHLRPTSPASEPYRIVAFTDAHGRKQHLLAGMSRSCADAIKTYLARFDRPAVGAFFTWARAVYYPITAALSSLPEQESTFWNVNSPEDLQAAHAYLERQS